MNLTAVDFCQVLPVELTSEIFSLLQPNELLRCESCSQLWRHRVNQNGIWRRICQQRGWDDLAVGESSKGGRSCVEATDDSDIDGEPKIRGPGILWEPSFCRRLNAADSPAYIEEINQKPYINQLIETPRIKSAWSERSSSTQKEKNRISFTEKESGQPLLINERLILSRQKRKERGRSRFEEMEQKRQTENVKSFESSLKSVASFSRLSKNITDNSSLSSPLKDSDFIPCFWRRVFQRAAHLDANWRLGRYVNVGVTSGLGGANRSIVSLDVAEGGWRGGGGRGGGGANEDGGGVVLTASSDGFMRLWNLRDLNLRRAIGFGLCRRIRSIDYDRSDDDNDNDDDDVPLTFASSARSRVQPTVVKVLPGRQDAALVGCDDGRLRIISLLAGGDGKGEATTAKNLVQPGATLGEIGRKDVERKTTRSVPFEGVLCVSNAAHGDAVMKLELKPVSSYSSSSSTLSSSSSSSSWTLAISVGADRTIFGWRVDVLAISLLWAKRGNEHADDIECCDLFVDDQYIGDGNNDDDDDNDEGAISISRGSERKRQKTSFGHRRVYHPTLRGLFVTGSWDGRLVLRDAFTGAVLHLLCGHLEAVHCVSILCRQWRKNFDD